MIFDVSPQSDPQSKWSFETGQNCTGISIVILDWALKLRLGCFT